MKTNVTLTIERSVLDRAKKLPQVKASSLSAFMARLLEAAVQSTDNDNASNLFAAIEAAKASAKHPLDWNRDELYDR